MLNLQSELNNQIQLFIQLIKSFLQKTQMIRVVLRNIQFNSSNRKQNFFELNPIYPDYGQKDFDIYNVQRKRVSVFDKFVPMKKRQQKVKEMIRDQFLMRKYRIRQIQRQNAQQLVDEDSGLPIGLNATYDSFIVEYKKNKNNNQKIQNEFKTLLMSLVQKFKVKSQLELIRLFRIGLAHSKKNDLKQRIRGKLMEQAISRATAAKNDYFSDFFTDQKIKSDDNSAGQMNEEQLDEASFQEALKQIDDKIQKLETELRVKRALKGQDDWDPVYGKKIQQKSQNNSNYDMNLKRGFRAKRSIEQAVDIRNQDEHIRRRINKLFFLRKLQYIKKQASFQLDVSQLPMAIRDKQKIINELAHMYKQDQLVIVPDLKEIYNQIDIALDKCSVKFSSQSSIKDNNQTEQKDQHEPVDQKTFSHDQLIWDKLDVERVFAEDYYSKQCIEKQTLSENQLLHVSPSAGIQLSLNRVPFNLYRHSQCEVFGVFTKYKHMILKDYLKDMTIDPTGEFNYFSIEEASNLLKRIKKPELDQNEKYYGNAKRKKSQAEVFIKHGTGVVTINGEPITDYFGDTYHRVEALKPLIFSETAGQYDLEFNVVGGGIHGQSECCAYALARALMKINPEFRKIFEKFALDGHDPRAKQPKRIGLYSARVRPPYVRR